MIDLMWGIVGTIVGTAVGLAGAAIDLRNSRRAVREEKNLLKMRKWNIYDSFYTSMIVAGLSTLIPGLVFIRFEMTNGAYALVLLSFSFLFTGTLSAIIRVRALQS
jgi:hypothetical protein